VPVKTVNLKDFAKELNVRTKEEAERLRVAILDGCLESIPQLVKDSPVDTGLYAQSWEVTKTEMGAMLENHAPHSAIIEYGARPFTPPIAPLLAWAKRVLKDPSQPPKYSSHVWALAKYTQNKIAEKGMQPKHILENAIPMIIENIKRSYNAPKSDDE
jgi:hypothetical protein